MKHLFAVFALIFGFVISLPAAADDLLISRGVLEDVSGTLTITDAAERDFQPIGSTFSTGAKDSIYWLRLQVRAPAEGGKVVLYILPTFLNEIRLYEPDKDKRGGWKTRVTGNHYAYDGRDRARISLGFVVDGAASEATYYLRLKTRSPSQFSVLALVPNEADAKDNQRDLVMVFFATAMLALLLWSTLSYGLDRQPLAGLFSIHQAVYTLFGISVTGYLAPFSPVEFPRLLDWANVILYCAINFTGLLFCRELFKAYEPPPALMRGLNILIWTFPILLICIALGHDTIAVNCNAILIKFTWVYFVIIAFFLRKELPPSRRFLQIFYATVLLVNVIFWVSTRISHKDSQLTIYGMRILIFDGLIIGGLFAIMLHTRARQLKRDAQQTMLDLLRTQKKFELEQKLKEQAEAQARTDYLTGLFNRRHFVELAERELERSSRYRRPFTMLLIDIDHFKAINDNWGHSFGDAVLQEVSRLMSGALRSVDIFGRIGGEEFAAVIVESEGREAIEVAQRICVTVADALIVSTDGHVTVSIGLAQLDGRNINFDTVLNEADQAMYQAKTTGRNRVEVHASAKCSEERNSQIATISHDDVREAVGCGPQI